MYTEKSVELKSDFYSRYGTAPGMLYFERVGLPFSLLRGRKSMIAFAADCGVRAYGRRVGDVIKVLDADTNICDVRFAGGHGAQILYSTDIKGFGREKETIVYTVEKLLMRMGVRHSVSAAGSAAALCDEYGSRGWCVNIGVGGVKSLPMPLSDHNIMVIRVRKNGRRRISDDSIDCFEAGEDSRIAAAAEALSECRTDVLFDMINESERAAERLLGLSHEARCAVDIAAHFDGVDAVRICSAGVMCIVDKTTADSAAHGIRTEFGKCAGYHPGIVMIK